MEERRKYPRIGISFPIELNQIPGSNYFYTVSKDLNLSGIKIITNSFLPKGDFFKININLIDRLVNLKARVAWCNQERISERYSAGLEFLEINGESGKVLSTFLNKIEH